VPSQGFLVPIPQRLFDINGNPADGWMIRTTLAGLSTPVTTYSNATLTSANASPLVLNAGYFSMFVADALIIDIDIYNASDVFQFSIDGVEAMTDIDGFVPSTSYNRAGATDSNGTYASATLTSPTITGNSINGVVVAKSVTFAETAAGVSHVATIPIPAGADLLDILVSAGVLWGAAAAVLKVGDTADDDGYFIGVDLKANDLLVGEVLSVSGSTGNWGGKNGAYLVAATGRRGPAATNFGTHYTAGSNILATITVTTPSVTTGRTYLTVFYAVGQTVAPVVT